MDRHIKNGMLSMGVWILFLVVLFGSYMIFTDSPFSDLLDEETAHPTNPVEGCADANPKTELPNDT